MTTHCGADAREQAREAVMDRMETIGQARTGRRRDHAAGHQAVPAAVGVHAAVPGPDRAGIDPEDSHAREASISFSSTSKFDQTLRVSSCSSKASISFNICWACLPSSLM